MCLSFDTAPYFCTGGEARTLMTFFASSFIECQITMFLVKHYYYKLTCPKYVRRQAKREKKV